MTDLFYDGKVHYCYLLQSLGNPRKWYVGYSDDPITRLKQHNGQLVGGAKETNKDRPWKLVCCLSGMPNHQQGLIWEWAWQNRKLARKPKGNKTPKYIYRLTQLISLDQVTSNAYPSRYIHLSLYINQEYWPLFQNLPITLHHPM